MELKRLTIERELIEIEKNDITYFTLEEIEEYIKNRNNDRANN